MIFYNPIYSLGQEITKMLWPNWKLNVTMCTKFEMDTMVLLILTQSNNRWTLSIHKPKLLMQSRKTQTGSGHVLTEGPVAYIIVFNICFTSHGTCVLAVFTVSNASTTLLWQPLVTMALSRENQGLSPSLK